MSDTLIVGLLSSLVTLLVCIINNRSLAKKSQVEADRRAIETANMHQKSMMELEAAVSQKIAVIDCKIDELNRRVEKHNEVVERTYKLESEMSLALEKISVANHRIEDLERRD